MVLLSQANDCFCGALSGIRRQSQQYAAKPSRSSSLDSIPALLPCSTELPARLASELRSATGGTELQCAVAGVCGPLLAVLLGAADGLGLGALQREQLRVACRRELRQLGEAVGPQAARGTSVVDRELAATAARAEPFSMIVDWSSTPAVPTYYVGVNMTVGSSKLSAQERKVTTDLAWVFRLLCSRARLNSVGKAPMMTAACDVLCGDGDTKDGLREAIFLGAKGNRSASMIYPNVTEEKGAGRWCRQHSVGAAALA